MWERVCVWRGMIDADMEMDRGRAEWGQRMHGWV